MWVKNITNFGRFCYLNIPCLIINITLILYEFFRRWIHLLVGKLKNRCFCWFPAAIFVPLKGTQTWRLLTNHHHHHQSLFIHKIVLFYMVFLGIVFKLYIKFYKFWWNVFPNISHMQYRTDPILGEAFCIFIFFYFLDSGLLYWMVCNFTFDCVTVKTENIKVPRVCGRGIRVPSPLNVNRARIGLWDRDILPLGSASSRIVLAIIRLFLQ